MKRHIAGIVLTVVSFLCVTGCPMSDDGGGNNNGNGSTNTNDNGSNATGVPVASKCAASAVACYDEMSPEGSDLVLFRPATRWAETDLTWQLVNTLPQFDAQAQTNLVSRAFQAWAAVSALTFQQGSGETDLRVSFESGDHGDMFPFDGADGTLGHGFFPSTSLRGTIHINADKDWSLTGESGFDLYTVVLHEIGHALGVEHVRDDMSVMSPGFVPGLRDLSLEDIDAIQRLYGDADFKIVPAEIIRDLTEMPNLVTSDDGDTDGDLIPDSLEVLVFGTDPFEADTDSDGVDDFNEIFQFGTDPLLSTLSTDVDSDGDGLTDADETDFFFTNPLDDDTDGDGLFDGDELFFFGTDPLSVDTDGDGLDDFDDPYPLYDDYGTAPGEDVCAENGWYGDFECDTFCPQPDPDCDDICLTENYYGDFECDVFCALPDPDCEDICVLNDWYGDGECDTFCELPDPDCGDSGFSPDDVCYENGWYGDYECDLFCPQPDPDCDDDCVLNGWYNDGECDTFCDLFDPDCGAGGSCTSNADCDDGDPCTADICFGQCFNEPADCGLCNNDCDSAFDGECDDGGSGALFDICELGSDCEDCGSRNSSCSNTCPFAFDGECDDGGPGSLFSACALGTDCDDCGSR